MIPQEVIDRFKNGHSREEDAVRDIKKYLLSKKDKSFLDKRDISIQEILNGEIEDEDQDEIYERLFNDWNSKLGWEKYGFGF